MQATLKIRPHVRSMQDDEGAVLLDLKAGKYYSLNGIAARIWSQAEAGQSLTAIVDNLQESYQASPEALQKDVTSFVSGLQQKGLVDVSGAFPA